MNPHYSGARQDGAIDFDANLDQIPDAVPAASNKHQAYNYRVRGRSYHVIKNTKNYRECGLASWYGTRFYKGKTSSGEPYNMFAMTAAHKTLPIPSYVRVTHLKTGRHVIVKVNDRGPFKSGRVIDLSYVAAKKLGISKMGTAPVEVAVIEPGQVLSDAHGPMVLGKKAKKSSKSRTKHSKKLCTLKKLKVKKRCVARRPCHL
jgi:rare lipoprotein A